MREDEEIKSKGEVSDKINESERVQNAELHGGEMGRPQHDIGIPPWEDSPFKTLNGVFPQGIKIVVEIAE